MHFLEEMVNFDIKWDGSGNLQVCSCWNLVRRYIWGWYKKVMWRILKFWFFAIIQGVKVKKFVKLTKIWTLSRWKIATNENFKNCRITFLYQPKIYLQIKFQHEGTCRFLDPSHFLSKLTNFLQSAISHIFGDTPFT